jgi:3-phenylpropionate/cinnamic acid dioxygenase small subunit
VVPADEHNEVCELLYREARYADHAQYDEWESLLTDDMVYWVPINRSDPDPDRQISLLYDNRARIATRIRMLKTGVRHAQVPASPMTRVISNVEVEKLENGEYRVHAAFMLAELQVQSTGDLHWWIGRTEHVFRRVDGTLKIARKRVDLINSQEAVPALAFLI